MDLAEKISAYEKNALDDSQVVELYQELYETGIVWELQGHYGRRAYLMLKEGTIEE